MTRSGKRERTPNMTLQENAVGSRVSRSRALKSEYLPAAKSIPPFG